ncbi:MAG: hypothetical protein LKE48_03315 [Solobacterium sp.]|jgi:hypothetical protein|nr:hypothetical protein [Solobacterium sp.]MCH4281534.1 hypothetical protein [Solobacterium sp.]
MAKTETTKMLEKLLSKHFNYRTDFYTFECTYGWNGSEIVDCISYNCKREVTCFEIKQSVSDFHSKAKLSFFGNHNYFVMPYALYEKVKDEIPKDIGVYVPTAYPSYKNDFKEIYDVYETLFCIKNARTLQLKADKEVILSSMLRCLCRDRDRGSCFGEGDYTNE